MNRSLPQVRASHTAVMHHSPSWAPLRNSQNIYVILAFSKISILLTLYPAIPGSPPHHNYVQLVVNNQHTGSLVSYIPTHEATVSHQTGC
jgi:hypothetical protein